MLILGKVVKQAIVPSDRLIAALHKRHQLYSEALNGVNNEVDVGCGLGVYRCCLVCNQASCQLGVVGVRRLVVGGGDQVAENGEHVWLRFGVDQFFGEEATKTA